VQWDTPYDLYHKPINRYVAEFIGRGVFIQGETQANGAVMIELGQLQLDDGEHIAPGKQIDVLLRADDIQHDDDSPMQAEVVRKAFRGADFLYTLKLQSGQEDWRKNWHPLRGRSRCYFSRQASRLMNKRR
jgi:iron(III) transport system ATP-binding protein